MATQLLHITTRPDSIARLRAFYETLYLEEFPDLDEQESLENFENYLRLKEQGWYGKNNYHIILIDDGHGQIIGGLVADYLAKPNSGLIEFIVIAPAFRRQGHGRLILEEITRTFERDAKNAGQASLAAICAEVNDPYRRCDVTDPLDGFARLKTWHRYGYHLLDFPYVQPALSEGQEAVEGLGLMCRLHGGNAARTVAPEWVAEVVREFQIWAMRIPDPDSQKEFSAMRRHLSGRSAIPLLDMLEYIGEAASPPFSVVQLGPDDKRFPEFASLYTREFNDGETAVDVSAFKRGSHSEPENPFSFHYWLWCLDSPLSGKFNGFASFFSFPHCGFGGYVALCGDLRGRGLLRTFLRLMERRIVESNDQSGGWYVECEPDSVESSVFRHCGFTEVPMSYLQPRLHTDLTGQSKNKRLELLYKPFGRIYARPGLPLELLQRDVREIIAVVYRLDGKMLESAMETMLWPANASDVFSC